MEEKKQNYIIWILIVLIGFAGGFLLSSLLNRSEIGKVGNEIPAMAIKIIKDQPKDLFEGYVSKVNPITRELEVMVDLTGIFENPSESSREVTVKIEPTTKLKILNLPLNEDESYVERSASFDDFNVFDSVSVLIAGNGVRDVLKDEPVVAREITRLD